MKTVTAQLANYATYHRDRRNIATHFVGIPMIVLSVLTLLSRPRVALAGLPLSPALLLTIAATGFYLALDRRYGLVMAVFDALFLGAATWLAAQSTGVWLAAGVGSFVVGWAIQFVGHAYEGRKPAFVDDLVGLLVGPLFVVAEAGFALGLRAEVRDAIEAHAGPTRVGPSAHSAAAQ